MHHVGVLIRSAAAIGIAVSIASVATAADRSVDEVAGAAGAKARAAASPGGTVSLNGKVGKLRLDRSTEAQVRRAHGRPDQVVPIDYGTGGRQLVYECGSNCRTTFAVSSKTGRLSDFSTNSRRYRTAAGTRVGMSQSSAERRERRDVAPGCLDSIQKASDRARLQIAVTKGRVYEIWLVSARNAIISC